MNVRKRPILVWLICGIDFLSFNFFALGFYLLSSHTVEILGLKNYLASQPNLVLVLSALNVLLLISASFTLFFLKRIAFALFASSLAITLSLQIYEVFHTGWAVAFEGTSVYFGLVWSLLVCYYSWYLRKVGVLN